MRTIPYTKETLMKLINELYASDNFIVAEQMFEYLKCGGHNVTRVLEFFDEVGVDRPAMLGLDLAVITKVFTAEELDILAEEFIDYAAEGGIISFCAHFHNPVDTEHDEVYYRGHLGGTEEWEKLLDPTTDIGASFKRDLDTVCKFMKRIDDAGIPVLWRPLHEANGNWFWFCACQDSESWPFEYIPKEYMERLWRYIYKTCTEEFGMKHLIWVYSPNVGDTKTIMHCYPGDDVVDIVAIDWYSGDGKINDNVRGNHAELTKTGKPFALGEFGPAGEILTDLAKSPEYKFNNEDALNLFREMNKEKLSFAWVLFWASWAQVKLSVHDMKKPEALMNAPEVITLNKIKKYFGI